MKSERQTIPDVLKITPDIQHYNGGRFFETGRAKDILGHDWAFVQGKFDYLIAFGLRGLYYQVVEPYGALIRCTYGRVFCVAVDLRDNAPTFGQFCQGVLDDQRCEAMWIPPGFAHGFLAAGIPATVLSEYTRYASKELHRVIKFDDPDIGIMWPLQGRTPMMTPDDIRAGGFGTAEKLRL